MLKQFFLNERNMLMAIILNSVVIFLLYFPQYENSQWLELIDHLFIILFVFEAMVKLSVLKPSGYFSDSWNVFDFVIIVGSLPALLMHVLPLPDTSLLIVLRLFRLIRLIRFIRFIPDLGKIVVGLGRALKASVFVFVAIIFLNILLALITCHFYGKIAPDKFGDPLISAYSIFQIFTVEGWNEIANETSIKTGHPVLVGLTRLYFVMVVFVGGIFAMSLANAVFVDEMTMDNNDDLETKIDALQEEIRELKDLLRRE